MKIKNIYTLLFFICFSVKSYAQADSTFRNPHGEDRMIPSQLILGNWVQIENDSIEINFVESVHSIEILPITHMMSYTFPKNVKGEFASTGYAPNWPPYYVDVLFIDENTIDLFYYHLGFNGKSDRYKRKQ